MKDSHAHAIVISNLMYKLEEDNRRLRKKKLISKHKRDEKILFNNMIIDELDYYREQFKSRHSTTILPATKDPYWFDDL